MAEDRTDRRRQDDRRIENIENKLDSVYSNVSDLRLTALKEQGAAEANRLQMQGIIETQKIQLDGQDKRIKILMSAIAILAAASSAPVAEKILALFLH